MRSARDTFPALLLALVLSASTAGAALSLYMAPEDLAERSDLIVEGRVLRTACGYDPLTGGLATYITLEVAIIHRGPRHLEQLVIREPGGRFGDIVHELDAVPSYETGEDVFVFLESGNDGALRTTGMFFGKYSLTERSAIRDLDGRGTIFDSGESERESMRVSDLIAVASTNPRKNRRGNRILSAPPEYSRLLWEESGGQAERLSDVDESRRATDVSFLAGDSAPPVQTDFTPMSSSYPARWTEADTGSVVEIQIDRSANPLGNGAAAAAEMKRAMEAWTGVPEARLVLVAGNDDYDYSANHGGSPASIYHGTNVILFGDPYDDISDPVGCSGVLAIGGYWRSSATDSPINSITFHPELQMYVIFNNDFECWLDDPDNLAEVATHELGHGIGFGHSTVPDAIMRSSAYGGRGPRLGDDDRDAVHCHYPHTFSLTSPNGGEAWQAGSLHAIEWQVTEELGEEPGEVALEYSANGGADWMTISEGEANDGHYIWLIPTAAGDDALVRVIRYGRSGYLSPGYPSSCSNDQSDSRFTILPPVVIAGSIPADGLVLEKGPSGLLRLGWSPSCSDSADDHAIYEGDLDSLRLGAWELSPLTCSAGGDLAEYIAAGEGDHYFLVAPLAGGAEGATGYSSGGAPRPQPAVACAPREISSVCN